MRVPVFAVSVNARAGFLRVALQHRHRLGGLGGNDRRRAAAENPGLLAGDFAERVAEKRLMVEIDRRHHGGEGRFHDIGGVETAAEPDFDDGVVGGRFGEGEIGGAGRRLKIGEHVVAHRRIDAPQRVDQRRVGNLFAGDDNALVEAHQMRGGVDVYGMSGGLKDRAQEGDGRALAVGAGDMKERRQRLLRIAETGQRRLDAVERQIDDDWAPVRNLGEHGFNVAHARDP